MNHGIDTSFLVAMEVAGHPGHETARAFLDTALDRGDGFALAPQVLAEFVHVVTDGRRFETPLSVGRACDRAQRWWNADEVIAAFPRERTASMFFTWLRDHSIGRKRLLDTLLAATYLDNEITSIVTANARDFRVFGCFDVAEI